MIFYPSSLLYFLPRTSGAMHTVVIDRYPPYRIVDAERCVCSVSVVVCGSLVVDAGADVSHCIVVRQR
jgi:hypothetical protein